MKELINVTTSEQGKQLVSAIELHEGLGVKTRYDQWINRRIEKYGYVENVDFVLVAQTRPTNNPKNPTTTYTEHFLTVDMAKELCLLEDNEIGRKYRKYLIQTEEKYLSLKIRQLGIEERKNFTNVIKLLKGSNPMAYATFTDQLIYKPLFGMTCAQIKKEYDLSKKASLRKDFFTKEQLEEITKQEQLATSLLVKFDGDYHKVKEVLNTITPMVTGKKALPPVNEQKKLN